MSGFCSKKCVIGVSVSGAALLITYYTVLPLFPWIELDQLVSYRLRNLDDARNYYTVVSAVVTTLIGTSGLFLGYFYFENRKLHDTRARATTERVKRLELLLSELDNYDASVMKIMRRLSRDGNELGRERLALERSFDKTATMLEVGEALFGMTSVELIEVLSVESYVDKCDLIVKAPFEDLKKADMAETERLYAPLIRSARRVCYNCIAKHDKL